ncbi:MAG: hypothetical protein E6K55_13320 [Gemmatimonadetes bacterium]|nr:MAG: hypothetical protein E6K55_13320 [Gemmatimonadota bacterium]
MRFSTAADVVLVLSAGNRPSVLRMKLAKVIALTVPVRLPSPHSTSALNKTISLLVKIFNDAVGLRYSSRTMSEDSPFPERELESAVLRATRSSPASASDRTRGFARYVVLEVSASKRVFVASPDAVE